MKINQPAVAGTLESGDVMIRIAPLDTQDIDLQIKDISKVALPGLPLDVTASNFGKVRSFVPDESIAIGIIHMVLQCIGKSAVLSALNSGIDNFVLVGNLAKLPQCREIFSVLEKLFNVRFHNPRYAEYGTAIGSALAYIDHQKYTDIG